MQQPSASSAGFRPRGASMEEASSHPHRPFSPTQLAQALPLPDADHTPTTSLLVRLPPELLRAVSRGFLPARDRTRLGLVSRHCHEGE